MCCQLGNKLNNRKYLSGFRDGFNGKKPKSMFGDYIIGYRNGAKRRNLDVK